MSRCQFCGMEPMDGEQHGIVGPADKPEAVVISCAVRVRRQPHPNDAVLRDVISDDGGLFSLGWYLAWTPGDSTAVLDGDFTADDLEAIANHMRTVTERAKL